MISNAVAAAVAAPAASPKGPSGRASEQAHNAFSQALEQTGNGKARGDEPEPREAGDKTRSVFSDARWHDAVGKTGTDETGVPAGEDGEAVPNASGDDADAVAAKALTDAAHGHADADNQSPDDAGDDNGEDASRHEAGKGEAAHSGDVADARNAAAAAAQVRPVAADGTPKDDRREDAASARAAEDTGAVRTPSGEAAMPAADGDDAPVLPALAAASGDRRKAGEGAPAVPPRRDTATLPSVAAEKARTASAAPAAEGSPAGTVIPARAGQAETRGEGRGAADTLPRVEERTARPVPANAAAQGGVTPAADAARPLTVAGLVQQSAPNPETSAGRQVAAAVTRELEDLSPSRLALSTGTSRGSTVKTMRLQLNPAELGVVHVRMQSVDGELRVTIRAATDSTARMLSTDSDAIRSALRAAGIASPDVSVVVNRQDTAQPQAHGMQNRDAPGQQFGSQENRGNTPNESRQSYRESASGDAARTSAHGNDAGDGGLRRDGRVTI